MKFLNSAKEIIGIVLLRFRLVPRVWAALLIMVNASSVFFLDTRYGQIALAAILIGALTMTAIHTRLGFVRLLGIGHVFWVPMLIWMAIDVPMLDPDSMLRNWLLCLIVFNAISLVIDGMDVIRYLRGERRPHYSWNQLPKTDILT